MGHATKQGAAVAMLTDSDYRELAEQCVAQGFGWIERPWGEAHVEMYIDVEYRHEDDYFNGTGASIPVAAECSVRSAECYTDDGRDVELDEYRLEELARAIVMWA